MGTRVLLWMTVVVAVAVLAAVGRSGGQPVRSPLGSTPTSSWTCPPTHPIKGNRTAWGVEPCTYHLPGGRFYSRTKPERCYMTETEAMRHECRRSKQ
jgi:hypothetical protein